MREIKFRAWDREKREMRGEGSFIIYNEPNNGLRSGYTREVIGGWVELVLMQYTELKDKNGQEIYEGDIVNVKERDSKTYRVGLIKWGESYPERGIRSYVGKDYIGIRFPVQIEVIGNIYENPELLKGSV